MTIESDINDDVLAVIHEEIATWRKTAARGRGALLGERFIVVDHLDRALRIESECYRLENAPPDLIGVSFLTSERAAKVVAELPNLHLTAVDGSAYAASRAEKAQGLLNGLADKLAQRARHAGALAASAGNLAKAERAQDVEDDARLKSRVLAAVVREMGLAAPPEGSKSRDELADRLFHAVSAHSLARVELLSDRLRSSLQDAYYLSESDAGAYGAAWRREIVKNGKRGLADESDAALLERVMINVGHDYLVGVDGRWVGDNEREFLAVMAQESQVEMMRSAIVEELHDFPRETVQALSQSYVALGLSDPYEAMLRELEHAPTAAPSP